VFVPGFVLLSLLSILWALAGPIFSSPDENAHAAKAIGQFRGELLGEHKYDARYPVIDLPSSYRYSPGIVCFAHHSEIAADCGVKLGDPGGTDWFDSWVGSYNPTYYYLVGWPSVFLGGSTGIYAMRIVGALACSALLALAFTLGIRARRARWIPVGLAFAASPMVVYLDGSISPQGMEVASGVLLTVSLLRLLEKRRDWGSVFSARWLLWTGVVIGGVMLAVSRALGPLWVVLIVAVIFTVHGWRRSLRLFAEAYSYRWIAVIAAVGFFSIGWTLYSGSLSGQAEETDAPLVGASFLAGAGATLRLTGRFATEAAGVFGWLDTPLPEVLYALYAGAVIAVIVLAFAASRGRLRRVVVGSLLVALLVPAIVQGISVSRTGLIWQGRYGLFLYLAVLFILVWIISQSTESNHLSTGVALAVNLIVTAYGVAAFVIVLRRYVVGTDDVITKMLSSPEWQPPLTWPVLTLLMILTSLAFVVWNTRLAVRLARWEDLPHAI